MPEVNASTEPVTEVFVLAHRNAYHGDVPVSIHSDRAGVEAAIRALWAADRWESTMSITVWTVDGDGPAAQRVIFTGGPSEFDSDDPEERPSWDGPRA